MMLLLYINVCIIVRLLTIYQVTQDPLKSKWYDMTDITRKNVTPLEYGENKQLYTSNSLMLPIPIYQIQIKVHFLFPRRKKHVCGCVETDRPFLGIIRSFNKMGGKKSKTFLIMQRKLGPADLVLA